MAVVAVARPLVDGADDGTDHAAPIVRSHTLGHADNLGRAHNLGRTHSHSHGHGTQCCSTFCRIENPRAQKLVALLVGLVHGIAGPGGILGVLPAVQLHDWALSSTYLATFCASSVVTMGAFAACYGEATSRVSSGQERRKWLLQVMSAFFSLLVGVLWIALCSTGQLEDVFG